MSSNLVQKLEKMGQNLETFIHDNGKRAKDFSDRLESLESLQDRPEMSTSGDRLHQHSFGRVLKALSDPRGQVDGFEAEWSQEFVEKTAGNISVKSTLGQGTAFTIKLPVKIPDVS